MAATPEKQPDATNTQKRRNKGWDNLIPAKKGEVRNPKGRPKGSIDIWLRIRNELMEKVQQGEHAGREFADIVAKAFVKECIKGKWPQMQELINREEGKVPDRVGNADDSAFRIEIVRVPRANRKT